MTALGEKSVCRSQGGGKNTLGTTTTTLVWPAHTLRRPGAGSAVLNPAGTHSNSLGSLPGTARPSPKT